jgi:adenylate cyclase
MPTITRKLAAIMFTDIVGYTALMGSDEDRAFEILRKNREIHTKYIEHFNGKLIKEMGDGMLAQFDSAIDSVRCAIEIQKQTSKELEAKVRIGIHMGDITLENHDVFGDGVNIASRLQSIADPGAIYISDSMHNAIRSKKDVESHYLGKVRLKNVDYPFKTYYIKKEGLSKPSKERIAELTGVREPESIVVLPFDNYTGSLELEYFVAGMHASLIGSIGKVSGVRVISKTTSNVFKNTAKSIPQIAAELGVNTVIEASVLSLEEKISLQVKLIKAIPVEKQLWVQDYFEEKSQVLNLYNTVAKEIINKINIKLKPEEAQLLNKSRTVDREMYESYLKGYSFLDDLNHKSLIKAKDHLTIAINKDPDWAPLYSAMAGVWFSMGSMGAESPDIAVPKVYENLDKAIKLDPEVENAHYIKAVMAWMAEWDWENAENEFLKSIGVNPNHVFTRIHYAHLLYILQRPKEAKIQAELAFKLDPKNPLIQSTYSLTLCCERAYNAAVDILDQLLLSEPDNFLAHSTMEMAAFHSGDIGRVFEAEKRLILLGDEAMNGIEKIYNEHGFNTAIEEAMKQLEVIAESNYVVPVDAACKYYILHRDEKAMEWLEKGFIQRDPNMAYIGTAWLGFKRLYDHPEFREIVEKMNLPMPKN